MRYVILVIIFSVLLSACGGEHMVKDPAGFAFSGGSVLFVTDLVQVQLLCAGIPKSNSREILAGCYHGKTSQMICRWEDTATCWHEMLHHLGFTHPVGGGPWTVPEYVKGQHGSD